MKYDILVDQAGALQKYVYHCVPVEFDGSNTVIPSFPSLQVYQ